MFKSLFKILFSPELFWSGYLVLFTGLCIVHIRLLIFIVLFIFVVSDCIPFGAEFIVLVVHRATYINGAI